MKNLYLFIIFLLPSLITYSGEGSHTGNGGGSSEANIVYAWENIEKFIDVALKSSAIQLDEKDRNLLGKITESLDEERSQMNIVFKSGAKHPELFELDNQGQARIAVTGDFIGDKIYFNYDRLYPNDEFGVPQPISVLRAVGFLVHEFGHHHKIKDHAYLDQLGAKVMMASRGMVKKVDLSEYQRPYFDITAFNRNLNFLDVIENRNIFKKSPILADLILSDSSKKLINLTHSINKNLFCDRLNAPKLMYSFFNNLHWEDLAPYDQVNKTQKLTLKGKLNWVCVNDRPFSTMNLRIHSNFELDLFFKVERKGVILGGVLGDTSERTWPRHKEFELNFHKQKLFFTKCRYENKFAMSGDCRELNL